MAHTAKAHPKFSVVMATYNRESTLSLAIESILSQSFGDFEFIIVDDASTDGTIDILNRYKHWDNRIHILLNVENLHVAKSVNRGISVAKAPYIARMDDDDISLPERFAIQHKYLQDNQDIDVCGGAAFVMGHEYILRHPTENEAIRAGTLFRASMVNPTTIVRKALIDELGGYPTLFVEDYHFWIQLLLRRNVTFGNIDSVLLNYRINQGQDIAKTEKAVRNYQSDLLTTIMGRPISELELDCHTFMRHLGYPGGNEALATLNNEQQNLLALWCKQLLLRIMEIGLINSTYLQNEILKYFPQFETYQPLSR